MLTQSLFLTYAEINVERRLLTLLDGVQKDLLRSRQITVLCDGLLMISDLTGILNNFFEQFPSNFKLKKQSVGNPA